MDVPQARRVELPRWINIRTVVGVLVFSIAFLGAQRALVSQDATVPVWVAQRDLATGHSLGGADLTTTSVRLPAEQLEMYALGETAILGATVTSAIREGEMIPLTSVASAADNGAGRSMTIPIDPQHSVGGNLVAGDLVDVLATFTSSRGRARTVRMVSGVEVRGVVTSGGLIDEEAAVGITVSVSPDDALRLALALRTAEIDVVRVDLPTTSSERRSISEGDL